MESDVKNDPMVERFAAAVEELENAALELLVLARQPAIVSVGEELLLNIDFESFGYCGDHQPKLPCLILPFRPAIVPVVEDTVEVDDEPARED